jgi:hypothetical protein
MYSRQRVVIENNLGPERQPEIALILVRPSRRGFATTDRGMMPVRTSRRQAEA